VLIHTRQGGNTMLDQATLKAKEAIEDQLKAIVSNGNGESYMMLNEIESWSIIAEVATKRATTLLNHVQLNRAMRDIRIVE